MNSHETAISRTKPSVPARYLADQGLLVGERILDFGCGRGKDADYFSMEKYDPYWHNVQPIGKFKTILCTYVLNVIENEIERNSVLECIQDLLTPDGISYITVRNDVKKLVGKTVKGFQGHVILNLPIVRETATYIIYRMEI